MPVAMAGPGTRPSPAKNWSDTESTLSEDERTLPGYDDEDDEFYGGSNASFVSVDTLDSYYSADLRRDFRVPRGTNPSKPVYEAWVFSCETPWDEDDDLGFIAKSCGHYSQDDLSNMYLKAMSKYHEDRKSRLFSPFRGGKKKTYEADMEARIRKTPCEIQESISYLLEDRERTTTTPWRIRRWTVVMMQEQLHYNFTTSEPQVVKRHRIRKWKDNDHGQPTEFMCIIRGVEEKTCHDESGFPSFGRYSNPWKHSDNQERRRWNRAIRAKQRLRRPFLRGPPPPPLTRPTVPAPAPAPAPAPSYNGNAVPAAAPKVRLDRPEPRLYMPPPPPPPPPAPLQPRTVPSSSLLPPPPLPPGVSLAFPSSSQSATFPIAPPTLPPPTSNSDFIRITGPKPPRPRGTVLGQPPAPTDLDLGPSPYRYGRSASPRPPPPPPPPFPRAPALPLPSFDPYAYYPSPTFHAPPPPPPPAFPLFPESDLPMTLRPPALPQDAAWFHIRGPSSMKKSQNTPLVAHSSTLKYPPLVEPVRVSRSAAATAAAPPPMPRRTAYPEVIVVKAPPADIPSPPPTIEASSVSSTSQKAEKDKKKNS